MTTPFAIPDVQSVEDPNVRHILQQLKSNMERIYGNTGTLKQRAALVEDLTGAGVLSIENNRLIDADATILTSANEDDEAQSLFGPVTAENYVSGSVGTNDVFEVYEGSGTAAFASNGVNRDQSTATAVLSRNYRLAGTDMLVYVHATVNTGGYIELRITDSNTPSSTREALKIAAGGATIGQCIWIPRNLYFNVEIYHAGSTGAWAVSFFPVTKS